MEKKYYYKNLDFAKGLAMFLVIVGHCIQCGSGAEYNQNQSFFDNVLFRLIYSFHMPLFMIISGFLYGKSTSGKSFLYILKTRTLRLIIPIIVWQTMMLLLSALKGAFDLGNYVSSIIEGFWFLWAVWWATVICALVEILGKTKRSRMIIHSVVILLTFITPDDLNFGLYKYMYVTFLIGYFAANRNWEKINYNRKQGYTFLLISVALFIALFLFYKRESFIYISGWTILGKENWLSVLGWNAYRTVLGTIGAGIIIYAVYLFVPEGKGSIIKDIGQNTSGIYILQTYANVLMLKFFAGVTHHIWLNILEAVIVYVACYVGVKLISKIPYAQEILFGQKTTKVKTNE